MGSASAIGDISNPGVNVANYRSGADWNGREGNVTTVGSASSTSFYGAFDMGGNVWEWTEAIIMYDLGHGRVVRGGAWHNDLFGGGDMRSSIRFDGRPEGEGDGSGFRLASIPEPATCSFLLIGLVAWGCRRRSG